MDAIKRIHEFQKFGWVLGLERMNVLLEKLGNPQENLRVIHVAGTNGKGSVCRYIYEVLQAAGYHCGLFTSPFLEVFNERIEFDGAYISDGDLQRCSDLVLAKTEEMVAEGLESPTEFEVITAVAFLYFQEKRADYVVLEVGLGGRGDSTNVVKKPLVSVITSISLDHTDRLGDTIDQIAFEKAGIIKTDCPVVTGTGQPEAMKVFEEKCRELDAPLYDACACPVTVHEQSVYGSRFITEVLGRTYDLKISMVGDHQVRNAVEALYALMLLKQEGKISVTDTAVREGFAKARQIGRFELMNENPFVVIDGAHNPDGARALSETVKRCFPGKRILLITGILADKEVDTVVDTFCQIGDGFAATEPDNPRKLSADILAEKFSIKGKDCMAVSDPKEAVAYAMNEAAGYDVVLFTGSLYLIGAIRGFLHGEGK